MGWVSILYFYKSLIFMGGRGIISKNEVIFILVKDDFKCFCFCFVLYLFII